MRVEPCLNRLTLTENYLPARLFHRAAHGVVDGRQIVCLRFIDVGGKLRAVVLGAAVRNEAQGEGARDDGLRLERFDGPIVVHLACDYAHQVAFQIHRLYRADVRAINLRQRQPLAVQRQLFRQCVVRLWNRRGGFGRSGGRSGSRG